MGQQLKRPDGKVVYVDDDHLAQAAENGYVPVSTGEAGDITTERDKSGVEGAIGDVEAGLSSAAAGATLGLSDAALSEILTKGQMQSLADARRAHPGISAAGQIAGAIAPALFGDEAGIGSLLEASPSGIVSNIGSKIAGLGEGGGALARIGATAGAGAFEGAAQNAGSYISDVALGDRDLTADGFLGAMQKGALWGGVAGGALSVANNGLVAARRLFPAEELTPEAVSAAETKATQSLRNSIDDSRQLEQTAREELAKAKNAAEPIENAAARQEARAGSAIDEADASLNAKKAAVDIMREPETALGSKDIPFEALMSNRFRTLDEPSPVWESDDVRENVLSGRAMKVAGFGQKQAVAPSQAALDLLRKPGAEAAAPVADDLMSQLAGTKAAIDAGKSIGEVAAAARAPADKLEAATHELAAAREDLTSHLAGKAPEPPPQTLAEAILRGPEATPDEAIAKALGKSEDVNKDIAELAPKVTRYEKARADVAEALGPKAPPEAAEHAAGFRQAEQTAQQANARKVAQASDAIDKVTNGVPAAKAPGGSSVFGDALNKLSNAGGAYEALRMMGVPLPDPKSIPVVGPLLSLALKAKILKKVIGKYGGSFAATAESTIAAKSTETLNRVHAAVDGMVTATGKAAENAGPIAAALGHKLFDDGTKTPYTSSPKVDDPSREYLARMDELNRAMQPGAIETAVRSRVQTSDPSIVDSLVAATTRGLTYLYGIAPKPTNPPLPGEQPWTPSQAEMANFASALVAYHDPAGVFERLAAGDTVRPQEMDCVKNCYPPLFAAAQANLVSKLADATERAPYAKRSAISMAMDVPMDSSLMPGHSAYLQANYMQPAAMPQPPAAGPMMSGNISLGQQTLARLDR